MAAKIQIKNDTINGFGGTFFAIDQFRASHLAELINNTLGSKGLNARFKYSDTLENLASVFLSGGEVLEDVNLFRQEAFKKNPDYRFCSADTIACDLRGLAVENTPVQAVENGDTVNLVISGFASPLHNSDYNRHLSSRRIVSLLNYLREADDGRLSPYLSGEKPGLRLQVYPEGALNHAFETDEVRETVFGLRAAKDRKIVISGS